MDEMSATDHMCLLDRVVAEIKLLEEQIRRSRAARGAALDDETRKPSPSPSLCEPSPPLVYSSPNTDVPLPTWREGTLLYLSKSTFAGDRFVPHFVVINEDGIHLYATEAQCTASPSSPITHVPFWRETKNSRGSRFKRAAVCWPLILPEDCPKANHPTRVHFAIEYLNEKNSHTKLIFAVESEAERNSWVHFITQYVDMFLAPRAESEELQHLPRGAKIPRHKSEVIDGEAPGGNIV